MSNKANKLLALNYYRDWSRGVATVYIRRRGRYNAVPFGNSYGNISIEL